MLLATRYIEESTAARPQKEKTMKMTTKSGYEIELRAHPEEGVMMQIAGAGAEEWDEITAQRMRDCLPYDAICTLAASEHDGALERMARAATGLLPSRCAE